jgi:DHHC palmitoyltransferase
MMTSTSVRDYGPAPCPGHQQSTRIVARAIPNDMEQRRTVDDNDDDKNDTRTSFRRKKCNPSCAVGGDTSKCSIVRGDEQFQYQRMADACNTTDNVNQADSCRSNKCNPNTCSNIIHFDDDVDDNYTTTCDVSSRSRCQKILSSSSENIDDITKTKSDPTNYTIVRGTTTNEHKLLVPFPAVVQPPPPPVLLLQPPPPRTYYCRVCDRYVATFDHHCFFLNTCIGGNNYRLFYCFLVAQCLASCSCLYYISNNPTATNDYNSTTSNDNGWYNHHRHILVAYLYVGTLFFLSSSMVLLHTVLILYDRTTYEYIKGGHDGGATATTTSTRTIITTTSREQSNSVV